MLQYTWWCEHVVTAVGYEYIVTAEGSALSHAMPEMNNRKSHDILGFRNRGMATTEYNPKLDRI
jgi:hypothetical protein